MKRALAVVTLLGGMVGCGTSRESGFSSSDDASTSGQDATTQFGDGGLIGSGGDGSAAHPPDCAPTSQDQSGCSCPTADATQPCYTGDPSSRNVGTCKDGSQICVKAGEFTTWGACTGDVLPTNEACGVQQDTNCNGKTGCNDPACATAAECNTGCTDGQTRPCYDGPAGTENVGTCKDGTQVCKNGKWPSTCAGEIVPQTENCCDALDHNCNHIPGCLDLFACILAPCCQTQCQNPLDNGCVCPQGSGDTETCPLGDHAVHKGSIPGGTDECCPCTDCKDINCCGEPVCAHDSWCNSMRCHSLPASCNGQKSADCDDFPEDCDEPCCLCTDGNGC